MFFAVIAQLVENENSMRNILYSLPFSLYSLLISHLIIKYNSCSFDLPITENGGFLGALSPRNTAEGVRKE